MPWYDLDLTALSNGPLAASGSALACYVDTYGEHLSYVGPNQHVHQLFYNSITFTDQDITAAANGPQAVTRSAFASFVDSYGGHTLYVAVDEHVRQLYVAWVDQDLTALAKGPQAAVGSGLSSFVDTPADAHSFYIGSDGHVYQLSVSNGTWAGQDLTILTKGPNAATGSALASFGDTFGYHALYIGADQHVHQSYFDNVAWSDQDLTVLAKGPQAVVGSGLSSFADNWGEHAFYVGSNQHVHHMNFAAHGWVEQDLTALTNGLQAATDTALSSFGDNYGDHVLYIGVDQHVRQLYFDNVAWFDQDLTLLSTAVEQPSVPQAAAGSALSSLAQSSSEFAFYISADQHVHLLIFTAAAPIYTTTVPSSTPTPSPPTPSLTTQRTTTPPPTTPQPTPAPQAPFLINAVMYDTGAVLHGPNGPQTGLTPFVIVGSNQSVNTVESPPGHYSVSGVASGTDLTLNAQWVSNGFQIVDHATGNPISQLIRVTLPQLGGPTTIYVGGPNPI